MNLGRDTKNQIIDNHKSYRRWMDAEHNRLYKLYTSEMDSNKSDEYYHRITQMELIVENFERIMGIVDKNDLVERVLNDDLFDIPAPPPPDPRITPSKILHGNWPRSREALIDEYMKDQLEDDDDDQNEE